MVSIQLHQPRNTEINNLIKPLELLISSDDMPKNWKSDGITPREIMEDSFYYSESGAVVIFESELYDKTFRSAHWVYIFINLKRAEYSFSRNFNRGPVCRTLLGSFESNSADEYLLNWEGRGDFNWCKWNARYGEYISEFQTWIGPNLISIQELGGIVNTIDDIMREKIINSKED